MQAEAVSSANRAHLIRIGDATIVQQALSAAAKLGVADLLEGGPRTSEDLAERLGVNDRALYRILRLLAGEGIFQEIAPRSFSNTDLSYYLRSGVPGSLRSFLDFRGSELCFASIGAMLQSVQTGKAACDELYGMNVFEQLGKNPEAARTFDEAMTSLTQSIAPAVAGAYDFGHWGSVTDVGGGNGLLLSAILKAHSSVRGVLADLPHVIEHARERGFLGGELSHGCN